MATKTSEAKSPKLTSGAVHELNFAYTHAATDAGWCQHSAATLLEFADSLARRKIGFWVIAAGCFANGDADVWAARRVLDSERLIVCDSGNHRVLIWSRIPQVDQTPADIVLGQPDFFSEGPRAAVQAGPSPECGLHLPTGLIIAEGKLLVADAWHHRLLVWNEVPRRSHQPPDYCIGQSSLAEHLPNRGEGPSLANMNWPYGLAYVRGQLFVTTPAIGACWCGTNSPTATGQLTLY